MIQKFYPSISQTLTAQEIWDEFDAYDAIKMENRYQKLVENNRQRLANWRNEELKDISYEEAELFTKSWSLFR